MRHHRRGRLRNPEGDRQGRADRAASRRRRLAVRAAGLAALLLAAARGYAAEPTADGHLDEATEPNQSRPRTGITHPPRTHALRGQPIPITAQVPPGLAATKVVLAYRAEGGKLFLAREMVPRAGAPGWYQAEIPAEATLGAYVTYYLEADNPEDQPIAMHGTPEHPHLIALAADTTPKPPTPKPAEPGLWLVLAAGSGGGYHSGTPEMNPAMLSIHPALSTSRVSAWRAPPSWRPSLASSRARASSSPCKPACNS